jgi:hypothetical protein
VRCVCVCLWCLCETCVCVCGRMCLHVCHVRVRVRECVCASMLVCLSRPTKVAPFPTPVQPLLACLTSPVSNPHVLHTSNLVLSTSNLILPMSNPSSYQVQPIVLPCPTHALPCRNLRLTLSNLILPGSNLLSYVVLPMSKPLYFHVQACPTPFSTHVQPIVLPMSDLKSYRVLPLSNPLSNLVLPMSNIMSNPLCVVFGMHCQNWLFPFMSHDGHSHSSSQRGEEQPPIFRQPSTACQQKSGISSVSSWSAHQSATRSGHCRA